jgi:cyclopropane fatty-acyl-phospholipid synthase-like methyltransferase
MSDVSKSRGAEHFERLYAVNPDPWNFATSDYERLKYDATMAALGERQFTAGFEIGCSIGVLTRRLAGRCGALLAVDIVASAVADARRRCDDLPHVGFDVMTVPDAWPAPKHAQKFDLIVLSEVLYFFSRKDIQLIAGRCCESLAPGGVALLVNYTGATGDDPSSGDEAAEVFIAAAMPRMGLVFQQREDRFRIDRLEMR